MKNAIMSILCVHYVSRTGAICPSNLVNPETKYNLIEPLLYIIAFEIRKHRKCLK